MRKILLSLCFLMALPAAAQQPLSEGDVLAASAAHAPRILESLANAKAARGDALAAEGAFDTQVASEARARATGVWNGRFLDNTVTKPLAPLGAEVYGGYRVSDGGEFGPLDRSFPIYEDIFHTNQGGEFKLGVSLSLLRDRAIDQRRFGRAQGRLGASLADINVLLAQIGVQHQALKSYQNWVASGGQLQIYRDLLEIALEREKALERRVREGDAAEVLITENRQNILRRQTLVVEAERQLAVTAFALSMFYRDADGLPIVVTADRLPASFPEVQAALTALDGVTLDTITGNRPELALIDNNLIQAENRLALARNELRPKLDFDMEFSRDIGAVGPGGSTFDSTDTIVRFLFEIPIERRFAKGRISKARAEMEALKYRRQRIEEQIGIEIRTLRTDLDAARRMVDLAIQEQAQAETMQGIERQRFENGLSDFFLLNMREERTADARVRRIAAQLRYFSALADFYAATVDLDGLGLNQS